MEEKEPIIYYKIMPGKRYRVFRTDFQKDGKTFAFYKIAVTQKKYDGTEEKYYKNIRFSKGVELDNETDIIINEAFENLIEDKNDKYNHKSYLQITNFEKCEKQEDIEAKAFEKYHNDLYENDDDCVNVDDNFLD